VHLVRDGRLADGALALDSSGRVAAQGRAGDVLTPDVLGPVFGASFAEREIGGECVLAPIAPR